MPFSISSKFVVQRIGINIYFGKESKYKSQSTRVKDSDPVRFPQQFFAKLRMLASSSGKALLNTNETKIMISGNQESYFQQDCYVM